MIECLVLSEICYVEHMAYGYPCNGSKEKMVHLCYQARRMLADLLPHRFHVVIS